MTHKKYDIKGMTCSACSSAVERSVNKLDGIKSVNVNLLSNSMTVDYDENTLSSDNIVKAVEDAGYEAYSSEIKKATAKSPENTEKSQTDEMKKRFIISSIFAIPLFYISMGHMMEWWLPDFFYGTENAITFAFTQFLLVLPIVFINNKYYRVGFKTLFKRSPNMDSLIAIGTSAALVYGIYAIYKIGIGLGTGNTDMVMSFSMDLYFESAGVVLTLITLGKFLEARAKKKTSDAIRKLINLAPKVALVERDGKEIELPVEELNLGDIIIVKPGSSIPADGIIIEGSSSIDEAMLTGESIPVEKTIGDNVIGASINKSGYFKFRATKIGDDTVLSQIIRLVEEASSSKAPIAKLADKISRVFVPVVITIAVIATVVWLLLGYSFEFAISIGIAVLVISCPCALGLATPTAIMVGTGKGAENGILIKSAESLETAHTINTVVMDKTGTITEGKPRVTDIVVDSEIDENMLLSIAASAEKGSEHPLADAIIREAENRSLKLLNVNNFKALHGLGLSATIDTRLIYIGNQRLINEKHISLNEFEDVSDKLANEGKTPLFVADENNILGIIAVADTPKKTSAQAIREFEEMGIEVIMLTGDNKATAEAVRKRLNISSVIAEVMPQDKESKIRELQAKGRIVAMIGDGINDAPALARADVGIAIGAGTDIAIESADIVLMKSDLLDAVSAVQLSKSVIKNIKENLFWAFIYNAIGIPLAAGVFYSVLGWKLNPMFAGAAMSLSSVCVVSNALRLKLFNPVYKSSTNEIDLSDKNDEFTINVTHIKQNKKTTTNGGNEMIKKLTVEGMSCHHCTGRVEKVLNAIDGVTEANADLDSKIVTVALSKDVADDVLKGAIVNAGYEVTSIQ